MNIRRTILKLKSRFYYYALVLIGSTGVWLFVRCSGPNVVDNTQHKNDSIAKARHQHDSIASAESTLKAHKEQARLDSVAKADSLAKAKKHSNPYKPRPVLTKYGIPINPPIVDYGVPTNFVKPN